MATLAAETKQPRVAALDVARGLALLGIFFVNAALFGEPFAAVLDPSRPADESWLSQGVYGLTLLFCTGKFYPLFSLLFGAGLAILWESARVNDRSFVAIYLRRLILLSLFGGLHVIFLWAGDILLIYALVGTAMLALAYASARVLLWIAAAAYSFGLLILLGLFALSWWAGPLPEPTIKEMPVADTLVMQYFEVLKDWNQTEQYDSRLMLLETQAMAQGPWVAQVVVRLFNYLFSLVFSILVMTWVILPCFCVGAALVKVRFFQEPWPSLRRRLLAVGLIVGLPLNILSLILAQYTSVTPAIAMLQTLALQIGGPLMTMMYLVLIMNWVDSGHFAWLGERIAALGRMALTGYLLESLLMSAVMLHWGLGRFGSTTWAERALWVLGIYLLILVFANLWMSRFHYGPLEWLWRIGTYAKWVRLRKRES